MKRYRYFFIVYAIAMLSDTGAYAATSIGGLATTNYVDGALTETLKGLTQSNSGSGNVVTNVTQTNGVVTVTKGNVQPTLVSGTNIKTINNTSLLGEGNIAVQAPLGYTAENAGNKTTSIAVAASANDTKYPTEKAVRTELDLKADKTAIPTVNNATLTIQKNGTNVGTFTANQASNTTVNVTVPTKVSDLTNDSSYATTTAVALKQDIANIVKTNDAGNVPTSVDNKNDKYPSYAAAEKLAANAVAEVVVDLGDLQTEVTALKGTVNSNKTAAENAIKGLTGTGTGTTTGKGMVKTVTQTNGIVTATRGLVTSADITDGTIDTADLADKAVTAVKTTGIFGYIPSGSANATATAQIWVQ